MKQLIGTATSIIQPLCTIYPESQWYEHLNIFNLNRLLNGLSTLNLPFKIVPLYVDLSFLFFKGAMTWLEKSYDSYDKVYPLNSLSNENAIHHVPFFKNISWFLGVSKLVLFLNNIRQLVLIYDVVILFGILLLCTRKTSHLFDKFNFVTKLSIFEHKIHFIKFAFVFFQFSFLRSLLY